MTEEQVQRIINEIRDARRLIVEAIEKVHKKETTEYQPCPICDGRGWVYGSGTTSATSVTCIFCQGAKTVVKSVTK